MELNWPRIRDLPEEEQSLFNKWLDDYGQTRPMIDGIPWEEQDGYYEWDYDRWKVRHVSSCSENGKDE